ncbi:MAG: response regulator [Anaerolineae bacterium]
MIRIMLVDDQTIVREGLSAMLGVEDDIAVVGQAGGGAEALRLVPLINPDVVLMDVRMPGMDGLTALDHLKSLYPTLSVIMVTLYDDPDYLYRAVSAGAAGYILKDASRAELLSAVRTVAAGGAIISPGMLRDLLGRISGLMEPSAVGQPCTPELGLTRREMEVLGLMAEGLTNQEIADRIIVSPTTVKTHVQNILQKLGVSDRTQAAVYAVRCGLIS